MQQKSIPHRVLTTMIATALILGFASAILGQAEAKSSTHLFPAEIFEKSINVVALKFENEVKGVEVNFDPHFPEWRKVEVHDDGFGAEALIFTEPTRFIQFRHTNAAHEPMPTFEKEAFFIEADDPQSTSEFLTLTDSQVLAGPQVARTRFPIIKRKLWGADESLRYWNPDLSQKNGSKKSSTKPTDPCAQFSQFKNESRLSKTVKFSSGGDPLIWPLQYAKNLNKIVIHHTDSEIRDLDGDSRISTRDYRAIVRAIYQFHTVTRGWGDVGYNYIIDPLGNIYEGRYGGDKVVGAHALCHNTGALGIAIIGNYQDNKIPEPALQAVTALVASKAKQYRIDPDGSSMFRGKNHPNVLGHKDVRATSCPGERLYSTLPRIRQRAGLMLRGASFNQNFDLTDLDYNADLIGSIPHLALKPNQRKTVKLNFKNTGKKTWDQDTWLHVALNNNAHARIIPILEDKLFVAANLEQKSVPPGRTGTFIVEVEAGYRGGYYDFEVAPVINGRYRVSRAITNLSLDVDDPRLSYQIVKQNLPKNTVFRGQKMQAWVELKNTGNVTWRNYGPNQIKLGTDSPRDRKSILIKDNPYRLGYLLESEVPPGKTGRFVMDLEIPARGKRRVIERFTPVIEGVEWLAKNNKLSFDVDIKTPRHRLVVSKKDDLSKVKPGELKEVSVQMKNVGDLAWTPDNMSVTLLGRGIKVFKTKLIPTKTVNPGKAMTFKFWIQAPYKEGRSTIFLKPKFNRTPIKGGATRFVVNIPKPKLRAQLAGQSERNFTMSPNQRRKLTVQFKNLSNVVWVNNGPNAIYLAPSRPTDRQSALFDEEGWVNKFRAASMKEDQVKPGEIATFEFTINPKKRGVKKEYFQLVIEKVGWVPGSFVRWDARIFGKRASSTSNPTTIPPKTSKTSAAKPKVAPKPKPQKITPAQTPSTDLFRVLLSHSASDARLTANTPFKATDGNGQTLVTAKAGQQIQLTKLGSKLRIRFGGLQKTASIIRFIPTPGGVMEITTMERRPAWNKDLNDNRFRETIEVRIVDGHVVYINELPLELYLNGLAEVSNSTHLEKQKAIAVLARSYAKFYMDSANRKFPGKPYDGSDDPAVFQRYLGYGVEIRSPNFVGAVALTEDEVVTYKGKLIKPPYFSQSDGRTRSAKEVWGWTDTPYLQSVEDPHCVGLELKGHGVGASGCGMEGAAKAGKTYDEMIKYYYQGVEIEEQS